MGKKIKIHQSKNGCLMFIMSQDTSALSVAITSIRILERRIATLSPGANRDRMKQCANGQLRNKVHCNQLEF